MNDVMRGAALAPEYSQLLADFPRFSADVMPHDGAAEWHLSTEAVAAGIEAGRRLFPMPEVEVVHVRSIGRAIAGMRVGFRSSSSVAVVFLVHISPR